MGSIDSGKRRYLRIQRIDCLADRGNEQAFRTSKHCVQVLQPDYNICSRVLVTRLQIFWDIVRESQDIQFPCTSFPLHLISAPRILYLHGLARYVVRVHPS